MKNFTWGGKGTTRGRHAGFSMIELLLTMGVMTVVGSMAAFQIGQSQPSMKADGAMRVVIAQLNTARELSITQRRNMQVDFTGVDVVQIVRQDVPAGTTTLSIVPFEGGVKYGVVPSLPDTPDQFGNQTAVAFGTAVAIRFSSDGSVIDQTGNPINGTVFLNHSNVTSSARAVTVLGATGRIRGYRWDGAKWVVA